MPIRVLIADDQPLIRSGLRRLLDDPELQIAGEAATTDELCAVAAHSKPDIILSETQLSGVEVVTILPRLQEVCPNTPILYFSASDNPLDEARAFAAEIKGFVSRTACREQLLTTLRTVAQGGTLWTGSDQRRLNSYLRASREAVGDFAPLTPREHEVLKLLTTGATNREISQKLGISHETVKEHVQHVLQKIGVTDRTQAAVWAVRNGLA
jgi:DNA-binding NarL/FixJ family response regulator